MKVGKKNLGYGGKRAGKYKNWLNYRFLHEDKEYGADWTNVCWRRSEDDEDSNVALLSGDDFSDAKQREPQIWVDNDVYDEEVLGIGQKRFQTTWVLTEKSTGKKARLVTKGFQDKPLPDRPCEEDSPTCSKKSLRTILSLIISKNWSISSLDVKAAFLQSLKMERHIYLEPPDEAKTLFCGN